MNSSSIDSVTARYLNSVFADRPGFTTIMPSEHFDWSFLAVRSLSKSNLFLVISFSLYVIVLSLFRGLQEFQGKETPQTLDDLKRSYARLLAGITELKDIVEGEWAASQSQI